MAKKLTKIVKEGDLNEVTTIGKSGLRSRDYYFSSPQSIERMKRVQKMQKAIRKSITYTIYDLDKASSPYSRPYSH